VLFNCPSASKNTKELSQEQRNKECIPFEDTGQYVKKYFRVRRIFRRTKVDLPWNAHERVREISLDAAQRRRPIIQEFCFERDLSPVLARSAREALSFSYFIHFANP
jgi:hypothetical protein